MANRWFRLPNLRRLLTAALVSYLLFGAGMYLFQRQFMYFPDGSEALPLNYDLENFTRVPLISGDGTAIAVWVHPARTGMNTIVYFHGNAGHLGYRADKFRAFAEAGFGLVAVSYRGYGGSEGQPTETGLYDDAATALSYALNTLHIPENNVILYGESLGTGIATHLATTHPQIALLVLEAPYRSVEARAQELYPYLPVHYLIKDRYPQAALMAEVKAPVLIFHGTDDVIIPIQHGRDVYAATQAPKHLVVFEGKGHT
ncbi:MAG: alpha/beta hydrolase, partial [Rickettsiales bacterium]|nr:alpha/beta hydrolase [Rickettsiales bacterium]